MVCGSGFKCSEQCHGVTCRGHGEQQQGGGVQGLSSHEERASVGVGAHRLRCPAEGKHQTQSPRAYRHQEGEHSKYSLCLQGCRTNAQFKMRKVMIDHNFNLP